MSSSSGSGDRPNPPPVGVGIAALQAAAKQKSEAAASHRSTHSSARKSTTSTTSTTTTHRSSSTITSSLREHTTTTTTKPAHAASSTTSTASSNNTKDHHNNNPEQQRENENNSNIIKVFLGECRPVVEFEKLNQIGEGTYGTVYRARDNRTGEIVALKKIKMDIEKDGMPITALREIKLLKKVRHPNIVNLKEVVVGYKLTSIFLVFEYAEHDMGMLLDNMRHKFSESEVKCLLLQLLRAVEYLHSNYIIHRDLKMSNMLYNSRGELKLADFGMARVYGEPPKRYTPKVVTLWYRAPELLLGDAEYTTAVDMWAVGCIFGELLLHQPLMPGNSDLHQLQMIFKLLGTPNERIWPKFPKLPNTSKINWPHQPYSNLESKFHFLSPAGFDLLERMLTYDPEKRISASEALKHRYFTERPMPQSSKLMPTFPSLHSSNRDIPRGRKRPDDDSSRGGGGGDMVSSSSAAAATSGVFQPPPQKRAR